VYFVVTYSGLGTFVHYGYLSCPCMYTVVMKVMKRQYLGNYTRLSDGRDSETSLAAAERQRVSYIRLAGLAH